jgi:hypothetical protein
MEGVARSGRMSLLFTRRGHRSRFTPVEFMTRAERGPTMISIITVTTQTPFRAVRGTIGSVAGSR